MGLPELLKLLEDCKERWAQDPVQGFFHKPPQGQGLKSQTQENCFNLANQILEDLKENDSQGMNIAN